MEITSHRISDAMGEHVVSATGPDDYLELKHDVRSRRCLASGRCPRSRVAGRQVRHLGLPRNL